MGHVDEIAEHAVVGLRMETVEPGEDGAAEGAAVSLLLQEGAGEVGDRRPFACGGVHEERRFVSPAFDA